MKFDFTTILLNWKIFFSKNRQKNVLEKKRFS